MCERDRERGAERERTQKRGVRVENETEMNTK